MAEYSCKIDNKVKAKESEIKKNTQGTNSGRKGNWDSTVWSRRKK